MKRPTETELRDLWLQKYHNTNTAEIVAKYPKELLESPKWFEMFPCSQEQSDEWIKEVKTLLKKKYKLSKLLIEMGWWQIELNCSPNIIKN